MLFDLEAGSVVITCDRDEEVALHPTDAVNAEPAVLAQPRANLLEPPARLLFELTSERFLVAPPVDMSPGDVPRVGEQPARRGTAENEGAPTLGHDGTGGVTGLAVHLLLLPLDGSRRRGRTA